MLSKQAGFSLVETMVAMALLVGAVTFGMNALDEQQKSRGTRTKQTMHRYIAIQVTQHINSNLPFYPPITPTSPSDMIVYVGCMNKDGVLQNGKFLFKLIPGFDERVSTGLCTSPFNSYEVRFFWLGAGTDDVKINLLTLMAGTSEALAVHNFKIFAK